MSVTYYSSLEILAATDHRNASWWASVARALDDLDERLAQDAAGDEGPTGAFVDSVTRQPSLSNDAIRLRDDHARLTERARRRRLVVQVAGDDREAPAVAGELAALAAAEDRHQQRSRPLFWDSFPRDIGRE